MLFKSWIKYFFLSFFSNPIAEESRKRSLGNGMLSFLLSFILLFCGLMMGNNASFPSLYNRSGNFRDFMYNVVENNVNIEIKDGKAISSVNGKTNIVIDTFINEEDAISYAMNDYQIIIDTRDEATTYNDFTLTYVLNDEEYSAEEWKKLDESEKKNYSVKINYSSNSLELTSENTAEYVKWILGDDCIDKKAKERCQALLDEEGNLPSENYNDVYELYVSTYYSDLSKVERYGKAPTMRSYYMNTYLSTDENGNLKYKNFVVILQNIYFCYFTTDTGIVVSSNGYFKNVSSVLMNSPKTVDTLFGNLHKASSDIVSVNYFIYLVRVAMFALIAWGITAFVVSICGWILKCQPLKYYSLAFKSFSTFWLFSGFLSAISAFIGSFFLSQTTNFWLGAGLLIGLSVIRCIEQNIYIFVKQQHEISRKKKVEE